MLLVGGAAANPVSDVVAAAPVVAGPAASTISYFAVGPSNAPLDDLPGSLRNDDALLASVVSHS